MPADDLSFMTLALELARNGEGFTSPNPMVGAVVVKDGIIVGTGFHRRVGGAHAEVNALAEAGAQASGATLYVTLEPCHHTGRTPPCTEAILAAGIRRVVMAMEDPNPAVVGGGADVLRRRGLIVDSGLCLEAARQLNEAFVSFVTTRRPFVTVKCAATLDGSIATRSGDARWVSGPESRQVVHRLRHAVDAILVGVQTVIQDDPRLTTRLSDRPGVDPLRLILDTRLSIPETAQVLHLDSDADTVVVVGQGTGRSRICRPTETDRTRRGANYRISGPQRPHRSGGARPAVGRHGPHQPAHRRGRPGHRIGTAGRCRGQGNVFFRPEASGRQRRSDLFRAGPSIHGRGHRSPSSDGGAVCQRYFGARIHQTCSPD